MKLRFIDSFKLLVLFSLTTYLSSSDLTKAQNYPKAIEIKDQNGNSTILYEESHALVIWAANYEHWTRLNNVESEAKQVENTLKQRGFKVTTIANPTGEGLRDGIKDFIDNYGYKSNNRLVIFFTGHGHTRNRTKGYLVPVDAPDPIIDEQGFLKYAFSMDRMMLWAKEIEAKHALFVFDSCFSGTVFKTKARPRIENTYIRDVTAKSVRQFIAAGDADEEVPAKSIFTPLFIRGLEGEADFTQDGYVTGTELGIYLTQILPEYTSDQTPQYGKIRDVELDRGDIVFRSLNQPISSDLLTPLPSQTPSQGDLKGSSVPNLSQIVRPPRSIDELALALPATHPLYRTPLINDVNQIRDVSPGDLFFQALMSLTERYGIVYLYDDMTFRPKQVMTRAELVDFEAKAFYSFYRLVKQDLAFFKENISLSCINNNEELVLKQFTLPQDVNSDDWYYDSYKTIAWITDNEYLAPRGLFRGEEPVNGGEMVVFLSRFLLALEALIADSFSLSNSTSKSLDKLYYDQGFHLLDGNLRAQLTNVDGIPGVNRNDYFYEDLRNLVERYGVINDFKANRAVDREEWVGVLNASLKQLERLFSSAINECVTN